MNTQNPKWQDGLPLPENRKVFPALDGLRACAVLMVFAEHYIQAAFASAWQWGWAGVNVFFVLSGFLITGILYDTRKSENRFRYFYIRRTLRIFPLFYGIFLVLAFTTPLLHWHWTPPWAFWLLYLGNYLRFFHTSGVVESGAAYGTLTSSATLLGHPFYLLMGHFWSLAIEEQFYLVFPWIVFAIGDRLKLRNACLAGAFAVPVMRTMFALLVPQWRGDKLIFQLATPFQLDSLLIGAALALAIRGEEWRLLKRLVPLLAGACGLALVGVLLLSAWLWPASHGIDVPGMYTVGYTLVDLLAACAIWIALQPNSILFEVLTLEPLRKLGQISYGFYVLHDMPHLLFVLIAIQIVGQEGTVAYMLAALIAFTFTIFAAALSYRFLELPFLKLKSRLAPANTP